MVNQNKILSFKIKRQAKNVFPNDVERTVVNFTNWLVFEWTNLTNPWANNMVKYDNNNSKNKNSDDKISSYDDYKNKQKQW